MLRRILKKEFKENRCPICKEELNPTICSKVWPCKHKFCFDCIKKQVSVFSSKCSLCRCEVKEIIGPQNEYIEVTKLEFNYDPSYAWINSLCYVCGIDEREV